MGWEGEGGGGGKYNGECLFDKKRNNDKYKNDDKYNNVEDGKGMRGGADDKGESNYSGRDVIRGPSFSGVGHRTSIVGPHAAAANIDNDDNDEDCHQGGGCHAPPLQSVPSCQTSLVVVNVANHG